MTTQVLSPPCSQTYTGVIRQKSVGLPTLIVYGAGSVFGNITMSAPMKDAVHHLSTSAGTYYEGFIPALTTETPMSPQECVQEIRRISGVTWKEIANIFGVSQRTMHSWTNGENVSAGNDALIREVLEKLRRIHDGNAMATAYRLRSLHGDKPLLSVIRGIPISELAPTAVPAHVTRPSRTDGTRLMANWDPTPPFRDRWDREAITEEITPVGEYPVKFPKIAPKRKV